MDKFGSNTQRGNFWALPSTLFCDCTNPKQCRNFLGYCNSDSCSMVIGQSFTFQEPTKASNHVYGGKSVSIKKAIMNHIRG